MAPKKVTLQNGADWQNWVNGLRRFVAANQIKHLIEIEDDTKPDPWQGRPTLPTGGVDFLQMTEFQMRFTQYTHDVVGIIALMNFIHETASPILNEKSLFLEIDSPTVLFRAIKAYIEPDGLTANHLLWQDYQILLDRVEETSIQKWFDQFTELYRIAKENTFTSYRCMLDDFLDSVSPLYPEFGALHYRKRNQDYSAEEYERILSKVLESFAIYLRELRQHSLIKTGQPESVAASTNNNATKDPSNNTVPQAQSQGAGGDNGLSEVRRFVRKDGARWVDQYGASHHYCVCGKPHVLRQCAWLNPSKRGSSWRPSPFAARQFQIKLAAAHLSPAKATIERSLREPLPEVASFDYLLQTAPAACTMNIPVSNTNGNYFTYDTTM